MNGIYSKIKEKSLFLAPMEGVTDEAFRLAINELYPRWDYMACDFLRIPSTANYPNKKIISHYGENIFKDQKLKQKNYYQILASSNSLIESTLEQMTNLGVEWIDLNLGCPSKTVNGSKGGSFLLSDIEMMRNLVKKIRDHYKGTFTAKIRVGYKNDQNFELILKTLEDAGVEAITIHGRTKEEMYKGRANWDYIKRAVKLCNIPIIGNGDIWNLEDINNIFHETNCHAIMLARSAMKTPWLPELYYDYKDKLLQIAGDENYLLEVRLENLEKYFHKLEQYFLLQKTKKTKDLYILKRFKSLTRYLFEDFQEGEQITRKLFRSQGLEEYKDHLSRFLTKH